MLLAKLFTIQNLFSQKPYYFKHNMLVKASEIDSGTTLTPYERVASFRLSAFVEQKLYTNWMIENIFSDSEDTDYFTLATFDRRIIKIDFLKEKFKKKKFKIWNRKSYNQQYQLILEDRNEEDKIVFGEISQNSTELRICIKKSTFKKILGIIKKDQNLGMIGITLNLFGVNVWLLQMRLTNDEHNLHIYWPQRYLLESTRDTISAKDLFSYLEKYEDISFYIIELVKKLISKNSRYIFKVGNKLFLHIDEKFTMFLYCTTNIPQLNFFEEFTIKLETVFKQDSEIKIFQNFKYLSTMKIIFSKKSDDSADHIHLQIIEYVYDVKNDIYDWLNDKNPISHKNIYLDREPYITSQSTEIALYTIIRKPKTSPSIKIYFSKKDLDYDTETYKALEDSIHYVIIVLHGNKNQQIPIDKKLFSINNGETSFSISFDNKLFSMIQFASLKSALRNMNGVFSISIGLKNETVIENIFCMNGKDVFVVSSNRLMKFFKTFPKQNIHESLASQSSVVKVEASSTEFSKKQGSNQPRRKLLSQSDGINSHENIQEQDTISSRKSALPPSNLEESKENQNKDHFINKHKLYSSDTATYPLKRKIFGHNNVSSEKYDILSPKDNDSININKSPGLNKTNHKRKITKTTTFDESSKTGNTNTTTDSENTFKNEESKSGSLMVIAIIVAVGVIGIIVLVSYIYFF